MAKGKVPSSSRESTPTESTVKRLAQSERQSAIAEKVCVVLSPCDLIMDIDCNFQTKETCKKVDLQTTENYAGMGSTRTGDQKHDGDVHSNASMLDDEARSPSNGFSPANFYGSRTHSLTPRISLFSPNARKILGEDRSKSVCKHSLGVKRKKKKQSNSFAVRKKLRTSNITRQSKSSEEKNKSLSAVDETCSASLEHKTNVSGATIQVECKDKRKLCKSVGNGVERSASEKASSSQSGCESEQSDSDSAGAMYSGLLKTASSNTSEIESVGSEASLYSGPGCTMDGLFLKKNGNEYFFSNSFDNDTQHTEDVTCHEIDKDRSESLRDGEIILNSSSTCENVEKLTEKSPVSFDIPNGPQSSFSMSLPSPGTSEGDITIKLSDKDGDSSSTKSSPEHQAPITKYFKTLTGPKCRTKLISSVSSTGTASTENSPEVKNRISPSRRRKVARRQQQMYLDLGQKDFGHVTCPTCGMVYTRAQPDDEAEHIKHHKRFVSGLRFTGWKNESIIKEYHDGRVIMVGPEDHPLHLKKVEEIRKVVDSELGFVTDVPHLKSEAKTFLFITAKKVVGCAVAVQIDQGYPVLPSPGESSTPEKQIAAWCCSTTPQMAQCGISRIWVHSRYRRKKVATRLLDCVRMNFLYGCVIPRELVAFSDPTPDGKRLAKSYAGTSQFLVFR